MNTEIIDVSQTINVMNKMSKERNMTITEQQAYEMYDDMLNAMSEPINIFGVKFEMSRAVKCLDELLYQAHFEDYVDILVEQEIYVEGHTDDQIETK